MGRVGFLMLFLITINSYASVYKSYYPWESDSILVAWVIDKFVDKNASFIAVDKKEEKLSTNENTINTSNSKLRRTARFTAFEMAVKYYNIKEDRCINRLKKIIRVLEMTPWKKEEYEDIVKFEERFVALFPKEIKDNNLSRAFKYLDNFCKEVK